MHIPAHRVARRAALCLLLALNSLWAAPPWVADNGDGTYKNPILYQDFSDPDAIRVGEDYYMTSSTFHVAPGLTLLHSRDLVNWRYVVNPLESLVPSDHFAAVRPSEGVWAPALRYHAGRFWIFYPDPDFGIYVISAEKPEGPWTKPHHLIEGKGLIDPCPFWDDDGRAWVVHGWAKSRGPQANRLTVREISPDATRTLADGVDVVDGAKLPGYRTLEGPKFYKRDGWYYIFAPAGGVRNGWQSVFRSRTILGPYEDRIVLAQGKTVINGPHQGAWVETPEGESWFLHFQMLDSIGRVVHLQPMTWRDGWPHMGEDPDGDGEGQPVLTHKKPAVGGPNPIVTPQVDEEFDAPVLGPQWRWSSRPPTSGWSLTAAHGKLRLDVQPWNTLGSLWHQPGLLLQRISGPASSVTTHIDIGALPASARAGLVAMGDDYAWIGAIRDADGRVRLTMRSCLKARTNTDETDHSSIAYEGSGALWLRLTHQLAECEFSYSLDGKTFRRLGSTFTARQWGSWVGTQVGLFTTGAPGAEAPKGHIDADWFRVTAPVE